MVSREGSAMVIVLMVALVAFLFTFFVMGISREITTSSQLLADKLKAKLEAESSAEILKFVLSTGKLQQTFVEGFFSGKHLKIGIDGTPFKLSNNTVIRVYDSGGMFPVNYIPEDALSRFLKLKGVSSDDINIAIDSLEDWYDNDDLERLNGAESNYYRFTKHYLYGPRNSRRLQSVCELKDIRGWNKIFDRFSRYFILTPSIGFNINVMDASMLSAVFDMTLFEAAQLIKLREEKGFITLNDVSNITGISVDRLIGIAGSFSRKVFLVSIESTYRGAVENLEFVIDCNSDRDTPYRVVNWEN